MSFTIILQYLSEIFFKPDVFVVAGAISVTATDKNSIKKNNALGYTENVSKS